MLSKLKKIKGCTPGLSNFVTTIATMIFTLFLYTDSYGQSNLSGIWRLQNTQHISGPAYGNALMGVIIIDQQTDSLGITSYGFGTEDKLISNRITVPMDGKPVKGASTVSFKKYLKSLRWNADKTELVITTTFYLDNNFSEVDFTRIDTLTLSADGTQLNFDKKSIETRNEGWEVKGVYVKNK